MDSIMDLGALLFVGFLFFMILRIRAVSQFITKNRTQFEALYIMAAVATIFALFFSVKTFVHDQKVQRQANEEYKQILTQNLGQEINLNVDLVKDLESKSDQFKSETGIHVGRFTYFFLDKVKSFNLSQENRRLIVDTINEMEQANRILDIHMNLSSNLIFSPAAGSENFKKSYDSVVNELYRFNQILKSRLEKLQKLFGSN